MATLKQQKSRKEYVCSRYHISIEKGIQYLRFNLTRFSSVSILCMACRPRPSQMTSSETLSQVYGVVESIEDSIGPVEDMIEALQRGIDELENTSDECQEKIDSIMEHFSSGNPASEILEEYINEIDSFKDELEYCKDELEEKQFEMDEGKIEKEIREDNEDDIKQGEIDDDMIKELIEEKKESILGETEECVSNALENLGI